MRLVALQMESAMTTERTSSTWTASPAQVRWLTPQGLVTSLVVSIVSAHSSRVCMRDSLGGMKPIVKIDGPRRRAIRPVSLPLWCQSSR